MNMLLPVKSPLDSQELPFVSPLIDDFQSLGRRVKTQTSNYYFEPAVATLAWDPLPPPQMTILTRFVSITKKKEII